MRLISKLLHPIFVVIGSWLFVSCSGASTASSSATELAFTELHTDSNPSQLSFEADTLPSNILELILSSKSYKELSKVYAKSGVSLIFHLGEYGASQYDSLFQIQVLEERPNSLRVARNYYYSPDSDAIYIYDALDDQLILHTDYGQ